MLYPVRSSTGKRRLISCTGSLESEHFLDMPFANGFGSDNQFARTFPVETVHQSAFIFGLFADFVQEVDRIISLKNILHQVVK